jgi:putative radical SAM enzyme (TIGR03279 family)
MELRNLDGNRNIIEYVKEGSIAEELEIKKGDILLSINGNNVKDIIDYKFLITDEYVEVEIKKPDGEVWILEIEKEYDEDLGIEFTNPLIDKAKSCRNKCIFCFIDQLPKNMRETLYFKDDDSRLSFLQGNFITLTNMSDEEIDRIIAYRISPINVSVHTTNPELRIKMLNNKNAGKIFDILKRFNEAELEINCQIVLVPDVNDGQELERTLMDLSSLYPSIKSVAIVPVGLTKYREGLVNIRTFSKLEARNLLEFIEEKQKKFLKTKGTRFAFPSDEFYLLADYPLPNYEEYEGFPQLENGVGMMKFFRYEIDREIENIAETFFLDKKYIIATGTLAKEFMEISATKIMNKFKGLKLHVIPIDNKFFGETITVSGLITGGDLISQLIDIDNIDGIIIPKSMLRKDTNVFLDDLTIEDVEKELNTKIIPIEVSGKEFINLFRKVQVI